MRFELTTTDLEAQLVVPQPSRSVVVSSNLIHVRIVSNLSRDLPGHTVWARREVAFLDK